MKSLKPLTNVHKFQTIRRHHDADEAAICSSKFFKVNQDVSKLHKQILDVLARPKVIRLSQSKTTKEYSKPDDDTIDELERNRIPSYQLIKQATYLVNLKTEFERVRMLIFRFFVHILI